MARTGVMLCGHGSRSQAAVDEFRMLAERFPAFLPGDWPVEFGYLEFADPVIRVGLDRLRAQGCSRILAVPGMLFAAMHTKNDIPAVLASYAAEHGVEIRCGRELGVDPKMIAAAADRIGEALARADAEQGVVHRHETCLVVIGRGASDPDANANVARIARLLWEGMGFGWCEVGYSGVTFPLVEPCLRHVAKLGYRRVVVFPYFLFTGILVDRIYGFTDRVAADHPEIQWVKAGYLNDHPGVLETFAERVRELAGETPVPSCGDCHFRERILALGDGRHVHVAPPDRTHPAMSAMPPPTCVMCKYRTQVLGFEGEVGMPQESHHHHVEGQGASAPGSNVAECRLCDSFCTGECRLAMAGTADHHHHDHDHHHGHGHGGGHHHHHHPPYPHADHPLGPVSVRRRR